MSALLLQDLRKTYENGETALHGINLEVEVGDFFALLGPNGAGKSTTIGIISTLVRKTSGIVRIFGVDLDREPLQAKRLLGVVPQEFNFNLFETVEQTLKIQGPYYGLSLRESKRQAEKYIALLGLEEKAKMPIKNLSGGQKRRVMIARALIHEPQLLFLDEPTAGVDIEIRRNMWNWLKELNQSGTTIILTTHYLEEAQNLCRNIAIINHGRVIANTSMRELLGQLEQNSFLFETQAVITTEQLQQAQDGFAFELYNEHTLHLEIPKGTTLNHVLLHLNSIGLVLHSVQPEANQLETLFVKLTQKSNQ